MNMKSLIQQMTDIETSVLKESSQVGECGTVPEAEMPGVSPTAQPMENPVSVNVNMTATGKQHVDDLISMMKHAGLQDAGEVSAETMPMRQDMDRLRDIVDEPEMHEDEDIVSADKRLVHDAVKALARDEDAESKDYFNDWVKSLLDAKPTEEQLEYIVSTGEMPEGLEVEFDFSADMLADEYDNEPDEKYQDTQYMTRDLAGGLNREKKAYKAAQPGDNAMAAESIKERLAKALEEKLGK